MYHVRLKDHPCYILWEVPENTLFIKPSGLAGETGTRISDISPFPARTEGRNGWYKTWPIDSSGDHALPACNFRIIISHLFCKTVSHYLLRSICCLILSPLIFFATLFLNWSIIVLQKLVIFCQTSIKVSRNYTCVPLLLHLLPISLSSPPSRLSQSPCLSSLSHTTNSHFSSHFEILVTQTTDALLYPLWLLSSLLYFLVFCFLLLPFDLFELYWCFFCWF